jgi:hypothetical protein
VLGGAAGLGDSNDPDDQVVGAAHAGDRPDALHIGLRERARQATFDWIAQAKAVVRRLVGDVRAAQVSLTP